MCTVNSVIEFMTIIAWGTSRDQLRSLHLETKIEKLTGAWGTSTSENGFTRIRNMVAHMQSFRRPLILPI